MDNTRQVGATLEDIRPDHIERYNFAGKAILPGQRVLDIACGVGYGSWLLWKKGLQVTGVDISREAIEYAERHYKGPTYLCQKAEDTKGRWDAIVTFETLEHLRDPQGLLQAVRAPLLIASVPNQEIYPFKAAKFERDDYPHLRHYTPEEFEDLIKASGYEVKQKYCQRDKRGEITVGTDGRFLIYVCY